VGISRYRIRSTSAFMYSDPGDPTTTWEGIDLSEVEDIPVRGGKFSVNDELVIEEWWEKLVGISWERCEDPRAIPMYYYPEDRRYYEESDEYDEDEEEVTPRYEYRRVPCSECDGRLPAVLLCPNRCHWGYVTERVRVN
jgi:hypothetical protein